jgi:lysophospholipase L1-like esterase
MRQVTPSPIDVFPVMVPSIVYHMRPDMKWFTVLLVLAVSLVATPSRAQLVTEYEPVRHACCLSLTIRNLAEQLQDWNELSRYYSENQELRKQPADPKRVVFMGDSITDYWRLAESFPGQPYVNRGIAGQTTSQMVVRMYPDVVALKPAAVVILAGTNDISRATGASTAEMVEFNLMAMTQLAQSNGIKVVLASILPTDDTPVPAATSAVGRGGTAQQPPAGGRGGAPRRKNSDMRPPSDILRLNTWMRDYARSAGAAFVDFHAAVVDADGMFRDGLSNDGVHPTDAGYALMAPLVQSALRTVLQ